MTPARRSIPFSITMLTLIALIVVPLASVLLWLGWRSVTFLEQRSADQRVANLETAVEDFLTDGLHVVISVGQALAFGPSFNVTENPLTDEERRHQLIAMLRRHPAVQAAFVGYADGSFIYAGQLETLSIAKRLELDAPDGESTIVRVIEAGTPPRNLVVLRARRHARPVAESDDQLRSAHAPLVRRGDEGRRGHPHRALPLRADARCRHFCGHPAAGRQRRHRFRFHAAHAVPAAHRLQDHGQFGDRGRTRGRRRRNRIRTLRAHAAGLPAGRRSRAKDTA